MMKSELRRRWRGLPCDKDQDMSQLELVHYRMRAKKGLIVPTFTGRLNLRKFDPPMWAHIQGG